MVPWCAVTSSCVIDSPKPFPRAERDWSAWYILSKIWGRSSGKIPLPLSEIISLTEPGNRFIRQTLPGDFFKLQPCQEIPSAPVFPEPFQLLGINPISDFPHRRQVENMTTKGGYVGIPEGTKMPQPLKLRHSSVPEKIWTSDPTLRRRVLYPAELRGLERYEVYEKSFFTSTDFDDRDIRRKIYPLSYGSLTHLFMLFHVKNILVEPSFLCFFIAYCTISSTTINFR